MRIYVICHDARSRGSAELLCARLRRSSSGRHTHGVSFDALQLAQAPGCPLWESRAFDVIASCEHEWLHEDFVGLLTHSFAHKIAAQEKERRACFADWHDLRQRAIAARADVVGIFFVDFRQRGASRSGMYAAARNHGPDFVTAWRALLQKLGYSDAQIHDPEVAFFFSNWWFARPALMLDFIDLYGRAVHLLETDPDLADLFDRDSRYVSPSVPASRLPELFGRDFFPMHPFVFERLAPFYFHHRPDVRVASLAPSHRIDWDDGDDVTDLLAWEGRDSGPRRPLE